MRVSMEFVEFHTIDRMVKPGEHVREYEQVWRVLASEYERAPRSLPSKLEAGGFHRIRQECRVAEVVCVVASYYPKPGSERNLLWRRPRTGRLLGLPDVRRVVTRPTSVHAHPCVHCPTAHHPPDPEALEIRKLVRAGKLKPEDAVFLCGWRPEKLCRGVADAIGYKEPET